MQELDFYHHANPYEYAIADTLTHSDSFFKESQSSNDFVQEASYSSKDRFLASVDEPSPDLWGNSLTSQKTLLSFRSNTSFKDVSEREKVTEKKARSIVAIANNQIFVEGEYNSLESHLETLKHQFPDYFSEILTTVWTNLFTDEKALANFLGMLSTVDYDIVGRSGDMFAAACYSHQDIQVKDAVVRVFEAWEQPGHANYLQMMEPFNVPFLEKYRLSIIEYLQSIK